MTKLPLVKMFRYFATIAAACAVVLFENSVFAGNDNYSQWSYSMPIYLNTTSSGANVAGNVTNFPVLVRLNPRNFSGFSNVLAGGADIRFSDTVGAHLPYQIERWADNPGTNDSADIWVLLPQVNGNSSGQRFKMYWGNSGAVDSSRGTAVFDTGNGFVGVWHLSDTNKTTGYVDATINALNATGNNMAVTDTVTAVIGKGQQFNGSNKYLTVASGINLANKKLTVSAWANLASAGADGYMFSQGKARPTAGSISDTITGAETTHASHSAFIWTTSTNPANSRAPARGIMLPAPTTPPRETGTSGYTSTAPKTFKAQATTSPIPARFT